MIPMTKDVFILLPGYDGNGIATFSKLNQLLFTRLNCLIINYPYVDQTNKAYTLKELISYVHKITQQRKLGRFHLVGFSMGGLIASAYAVKYPQQIRSLILISSSIQPRLSVVYRSLIKSAYHLFKIPLFARFFSLIYCSSILSSLVSKSPLPALKQNSFAKEAYPIFSTLANVLYTSINADLTPQIAQSTIPKYTILFNDDYSFPATIYSPILKDIGFNIIVNKHGGHATSQNYWQQVANTLLRLFE